MSLYFGCCRLWNLFDELLNSARSILWAMFLMLPKLAKVTSYKSSDLNFQFKCCLLRFPIFSSFRVLVCSNRHMIWKLFRRETHWLEWKMDSLHYCDRAAPPIGLVQVWKIIFQHQIIVQSWNFLGMTRTLVK